MTKRRLQLDGTTEDEPLKPPSIPAAINDDTHPIIHRKLMHRICPDCEAHGLNTYRQTGTVTLFSCLNCGVMFEIDFSNSYFGAADVKITRYRECRLCEGKGQRYVRQKPISAPAKLTLTVCGDCDGRGRILVNQL